ncbi:hypothetical protein NKG05_23735 [Oerskovia sp. M15]
MLGRARAVQVDETTCGSAVLAVLAAAGDPVVALWLVSGEDASRGASSHVVSGDQAGATARELETSSGRFQALQRLLKARTTRHALGPFPGRGLGTPPWTAARDALRGRALHPPDPRGRRARRPRARERAAVRRGRVPVPLYTGGDVGHGWSTAVPRHVVLLAGVSGPQDAGDHGPLGGRWCSVYEPSSGALHRLRVADLLAGTGAAGNRARPCAARSAGGRTRVGLAARRWHWRRAPHRVTMDGQREERAMSTVPGAEAWRDAAWSPQTTYRRTWSRRSRRTLLRSTRRTRRTTTPDPATGPGRRGGRGGRGRAGVRGPARRGWRGRRRRRVRQPWPREKGDVGCGRPPPGSVSP